MPPVRRACGTIFRTADLYDSGMTAPGDDHGRPAEDASPAEASVLSSRTSHELRTPLQAIIGFTGTLLLQLPGPLNDEQVRQLQLVQESARQLLSLINELSRPR